MRAFTNQQINTIIPNERVVPEFLHYSLSIRRTELQALASVGTRTPILIKSSFEKIEIALPQIPVQRKIAAILSAYDDLIDNNTRRIQILEQMARTIYEEWFVRFRFPGHEDVPLVDSESGPIPEEWSISNLGLVSVNFDSKRVPLSGLQRANMQGSYPYYGAAKVVDYVDDYIFDGKYLLVAEDGSVITENRTPVLQLASGKFWVNNHTHVLQGKVPISTYFLYLFLSRYDISGHVTGAAQPKVTQANLNRILVVVPCSNLLAQFDALTESIFCEIEILGRQNGVLRTTRDLLLPRLVSGELDVSELDIDTSALDAGPQADESEAAIPRQLPLVSAAQSQTGIAS